MNRRLKAGFSIVEILLAASMLGLIVTALVGAFIYGRETTAAAGMRTRALFLAEEGVEASRNIRDSGFANLTVGTHGLAISGGEWIFSGASDTTGIFTRQITVSAVDAARSRITSTVTWQQTPSRTGAASVDTYLTNWNAGSVVSQCNSYCQSLLYATGTCRQNVAQCTVNGETHEAGGDAFCPGGPSANTCCCHP